MRTQAITGEGLYLLHPSGREMLIGSCQEVDFGHLFG